MTFMNLTGFAGLPGAREVLETVEAAVTFGPTEYNQAFLSSIEIDSAAVDSGSTPTSLLRPGLVLGRNKTTGHYSNWDPTAATGVEQPACILLWATDMLYHGSAENKFLGWALFGGMVKSSSLIVPSGYTQYAKSILSPRFIFDDYMQDNMAMTALGWRNIRHRTTDLTLTAADHGTLFTNKGASGAVTFTLPAVAGSQGLRFGFLGYAAQNVVVTGPGASTVIGEGAVGQTVTLTGATAEGGLLEVIGVDNAVYAVVSQIGDGQAVTIA